MREILPSHIVVSLAGHDRGRLYHVLRVDGECALVADGKIRTVQRPKRKKLRHVAYAGQSDSPAARKLAAGEEPTSREIRESIAAFRDGRAFYHRGGETAWQKTMS